MVMLPFLALILQLLFFKKSIFSEILLIEDY